MSEERRPHRPVGQFQADGDPYGDSPVVSGEVTLEGSVPDRRTKQRSTRAAETTTARRPSRATPPAR